MQLSEHSTQARDAMHLQRSRPGGQHPQLHDQHAIEGGKVHPALSGSS